MQLLKLYLGLLTVLPAFCLAGADDWEVARFRSNHQVFLRFRQDSRIKTRLMGGFRSDRKLISVQQMSLNREIERIIYDAGEIGSFVQERTFRAVLFDKRTKRIFGDFPIVTKASRDVFDPVWIEQPGVIAILEPQDDQGTALKTRINLTSGEISESIVKTKIRTSKALGRVAASSTK